MSDAVKLPTGATVVHLCKFPKREFFVTFMPERVKLDTSKMTYEEQLYFEADLTHGPMVHEIVIPVGVKRRELIPFIGHRVKMTLEVLP